MKIIPTPAQGWSRTVYKTGLTRSVRGPADPLPTIPPSALAPFPPEGDIGDGMLLASASTTDLNITVATNGDVLPADVYTLYFDDVAHGAEVTIADPIPTSVALPLTAAARTEGVHTVQYRIHSTISGLDYESAIIKLTVDLAAAGEPEQCPRPEDFDQAILDNGLTLELLTDLGDQVTASLGAYGGSRPGAGMASGDIITPYVADKPSATVTVSDADLINDHIEIVYEKAAIIAASDGLRDFYYTVTDRAGNVSGPSHVQPIQVVVNSGITNLAPPLVPAYVDADDPILDAEARAGVHVTIPANPLVLSGDQVFVRWGSRLQGAAAVLADDTEFDVIIPALEVFAQSPDTTAFDVLYEVKRAGASLGISGPTNVSANLDTAGGIDPDPSTEWNENLKPVAVFGGVDNVANIISVPDSEVDGTAVVPWTAVDDTTVVFQVDDVITLLWNGSPLAVTRTIDADDITEAMDITLTVTAAEIQTGGSGDIVVTYRIARPVTSTPDFNTTVAVDTPVEVKSATGLPGGTGPLTAAEMPEGRTTPTFPDTYLFNKSECAGGTEVRIPHYVNKKEGDKITLTYAATDAITGGTDIPESHFDPAVYEVPAAEVGTSSSFDIPEANLLAVKLQGNGKVNYSVENDIGSKSAPVTTAYIDNR